MTENQTEKPKKMMHRDQIIEAGNKRIKFLVQKNVEEFASFTENEILDLSVGHGNVSRNEILLEEISPGIKEKIIYKVKAALSDMGLLLEKSSEPYTYKIFLKNGGETETA